MQKLQAGLKALPKSGVLAGAVHGHRLLVKL